MQDSEQFVSFLHSLSDMGAAMRTVITKVLSNGEMYNDFNQGELHQSGNKAKGRLN